MCIRYMFFQCTQNVRLIDVKMEAPVPNWEYLTHVPAQMDIQEVCVKPSVSKMCPYIYIILCLYAIMAIVTASTYLTSLSFYRNNFINNDFT